MSKEILLFFENLAKLFRKLGEILKTWANGFEAGSGSGGPRSYRKYFKKYPKNQWKPENC